MASDKIAWFTHRTKRGVGSNWVGTSSGAEGDMLRTMLDDVKASGFQVTQLVMDHDTSSSNIACTAFPEVQITYCGNHSAKTFHRDLANLKAIPCKVCISYEQCMHWNMKHNFIIMYIIVHTKMQIKGN